MGSGFNSRKTIVWATLVILIVLVAVFFTVFQKRNDNQSPTDENVVTTKYGKLRGEMINTEDTGKHIQYVAFRGVPYAQPPVGELRFKGPKPFPQWTGIRNATVEGNACTQRGFSGSEDCLYLNVYTPKLPAAKDPKLAVYVFIHGGVWQYGSGGAAEFGPEFFITQDVVVVTMNYRMGVLASLCLDTDEIPGNAGLRDQLQVLRWVHENIAAFGGDPAKVTVGGQSSGSVSASWLSILPQTKSLIRYATLQSGTALSGVMALNDKYREFANAIYTHLTGKSGDSASEMTSVFMKASYLDLYYAAENATLLLQKTKGLGTDMSFFYYPNIENRPDDGKEEILIRKDAESYFISGEANDIPIILGETKQEWTVFFSLTPMFNNDALLQEGIKNLITYVPESIVPKPETQKLLDIEEIVAQLDITKIVDQIRDHFFNDPALPADCNTNCRMTKYMHQVYMMADASHMLRVRAKYLSSPTFAYQFNLESDFNVKSENLPDYLKNDVIHGDDMSYLWHRTRSAQNYYGDNTASMALRRQVALFANFIKSGNPTPTMDNLITTMWEPVVQGGEESYLEITETLTQQKGSMADPDGALWNEIFLLCRGGKSP